MVVKRGRIFLRDSSLEEHACMNSSMERLRKFLPELEPFYINNQILLFAGFGYLKSSSKWKNFLYGIYRFIWVFSLTTTFSIQLLDVYLLLGDPGQLAEDACAILLTDVIVLKLHVLTYRTRLIEDLQHDFMVFRESRKHPEEEKIWNEASKKIYLMTKAFYLMGTSCVIFWIIFPALEASSGRLLPYPWQFPVDKYQSPYYEAIYVFQAVSLFGFLINIVSIDLGYCSYIVLIIAQYDVLCRDIRIMTVASRWPEETKDLMKKLKRAVKLHNYILMQLDKLTALFKDIYFLQMSLAALFMAIVVVDTSLNNKGLSLKLFQRVLYTASTCFDTWMMCFWGSQLQQKSLDLTLEIYDTPWLEMDVKMRKMMSLMIAKAQKVPKLKNGFLSFELPLFLEIMKLSYNAAALLKNVS